MENLGTALAIGAVGSLIGSVITAFGSYGLRFTRETIETAKGRFQAETDTFHNGGFIGRTAITNDYLFSALRYLFAGNLFWILPEFVDAALTTTIETVGVDELDTEQVRSGFWILSLFLKGIGVLLFYFGLGQIARWIRIKNTPPEAKVVGAQAVEPDLE